MRQSPEREVSPLVGRGSERQSLERKVSPSVGRGSERQSLEHRERQIRIRAGQVQAIAELNDTKTADAIWKALPLSESGNTWGDEIYFSIPVKLQEEEPQSVVALGDLGYWPPGTAFCIFFGPTPMSRGQEIRPASPVNVFGRIVGDPKVFLKVRDGEMVTIERAEAL